MESHGAMEFCRHFGLLGHLPRDITYRVQMGMPVYNKLLESMKLSENHHKSNQSWPFVDLGPEYPFPQELLPKHSQAESRVPPMTLIA